MFYRYNKADDVIVASACNACHACSDTCHARSIHISTHSAYTNLSDNFNLLVTRQTKRTENIRIKQQCAEEKKSSDRLKVKVLELQAQQQGLREALTAALLMMSQRTEISLFSRAFWIIDVY